MKRLTQIFQALLGVAALIFTTLLAAGRLAWRAVKRACTKCPKWLKRTLIATVILLPTAFVALVAYVVYDEEYGRSSYWDRKLSDNITLHAFSNDKYKVYDHTTGKYLTSRLNWVSEVAENDSLAVYALPNKRGFINVNTGRIVIDARANDYSKAWVFSEGLAAVMKDGKIGFINAQNEVVIPFRFDYANNDSICNFGYAFHNGLCVMTTAEGNMGLIDKSGNWVLEPSYNEVWSPHKSGYRVVIKDKKYGVLDADCAVVYPVEYGYISIVDDGFVLTKSGRKWQVDFDGNTVHPFLFDDIYYLNYSYSYNDNGDTQYAFADFAKYEVQNCYGIMNRHTGEALTPAIYSDIIMLSSCLFEVKERDSDNWYLLDDCGNVVKNSLSH